MKNGIYYYAMDENGTLFRKMDTKVELFNHGDWLAARLPDNMTSLTKQDAMELYPEAF